MVRHKKGQGGGSSWVLENLVDSIKEGEERVANMICVGEQERQSWGHLQRAKRLDILDFIPFTVGVAKVIQVT